MAKESVKTPEQLVAEATGVELRPCDCGMFEGWKNGQSTGRAMASEVRLWQHAVHLQSELARVTEEQDIKEQYRSIMVERSRADRMEKALRKIVGLPHEGFENWRKAISIAKAALAATGEGEKTK